MDKDFLEKLAIKRRFDAENQQKYKNISNERLLKICITKIRTTMIGALDIVEKKLKMLWSSEDGNPTREQLLLSQMFQDIRKDILDKGNQQIRNLEDEFQHYDIEWKRYTLNLPIKQPDGQIKQEKKDNG